MKDEQARIEYVLCYIYQYDEECDWEEFFNITEDDLQ